MTTKILPLERGEWERAIDTFVNMNRGRRIKVERYGRDRPHEHMEEGSPLFSLTYSPPEEEDRLVIAVGKDRVEHEYPVAAPREVWVQSAPQEAGGAMEIVDGEGTHVSIAFE
jgi:hypothetical protein